MYYWGFTPNIGEPDSLLDWEIESYPDPDWGTWSFNPDNGTDLLQGDSILINVEVISPDEEEMTFTGEIVLVNSENSEDTCTIDVSLVTPVSKVPNNQNIPSTIQGIYSLFNKIFFS